MPATVTLPTTTLAEAVGPTAKLLKLTSTADVYPGRFMYLDGELVRVISLGVDPWVNVERGVDGTTARQHVSLVPIFIGTGEQFYSQDPKARPEVAIAVSPWINVRNGKVWFAQGDTVGPDPDRWWAEQVTTRSTGALGVTVTTRTPESST